VSLISTQVTVVATTFTALHAANPNGWTKVTVSWSSTTVPLYVGPSGVLEATGYRVPFGTAQTFDVPPSDILFASSTANVTAYVLRSSIST
jgi:hypothetical protein